MEDVAVLNPTGYRTLKRRYPAYSNGVVCCIKNRNPIALIFLKIYGTFYTKMGLVDFINLNRYGLTHDNSRSRPADVLVTRWEKGLPAALDITVTSPLNPAILDESCSTAGAAAVAAESRKHVANDPKQGRIQDFGKGGV